MKTHIQLSLSYHLWTILMLPMIVFLLCSCQSEDTTEAASQVEVALDTTYYRVSVDRLRMRNSPGLTSEAITLLPEGVIVRYWGDHSQEKARISLRGKEIEDYWKHVRYGKQDGWVFGGALEQQEDTDVADALIVPGQRVGPILANDTEQSIIDRIGSDQVVRGEFMVGEGEMLEVSYIFPGTDKELILLWSAQDFVNLREIRITKSNAPWKTEAGMSIGTSLKKVEEINGKPFLMSGFQWDYAGSTMSWNSGKLSSDLVVTFAEPKRVHKSLIGDQEISSESAPLRRANPTIQVLRIIFS